MEPAVDETKRRMFLVIRLTFEAGGVFRFACILGVERHEAAGVVLGLCSHPIGLARIVILGLNAVVGPVFPLVAHRPSILAKPCASSAVRARTM
jgi:hypothetical protein